jgi:hypothetical protein
MTMTDTASTRARPSVVRWRTGAAELAYTDSGGDGDTLVLIHGGGLADWFTPLAATGAARSRCLLPLSEPEQLAQVIGGFCR